MVRSIPDEYFVKYSSSVTSEEEYLTKYSSGILLTTSCSESYTNLPQRLYEDSICGLSNSPREIKTDVEEDPTFLFIP